MATNNSAATQVVDEEVVVADSMQAPAVATINKSTAQSVVEKVETYEDRYQQTGFFNVSTMAKQRVADKRKRKGLGEIKPREKYLWGQFVVFSGALIASKTITAPMERVRILMQIRHMPNLKTTERPSSSSLTIMSCKFNCFFILFIVEIARE